MAWYRNEKKRTQDFGFAFFLLYQRICVDISFINFRCFLFSLILVFTKISKRNTISNTETKAQTNGSVSEVV